LPWWLRRKADGTNLKALGLNPRTWGTNPKAKRKRAEAYLCKWFKAHSEYLKTEKWQKKRKLVMERENNLCQGCREAPAEHVHHLSYAHWRDELLFELVALCKSCHERAHGRKL